MHVHDVPRPGSGSLAEVQGQSKSAPWWVTCPWHQWFFWIHLNLYVYFNHIYCFLFLYFIYFFYVHINHIVFVPCLNVIYHYKIIKLFKVYESMLHILHIIYYIYFIYYLFFRFFSIWCICNICNIWIFWIQLRCPLCAIQTIAAYLSHWPDEIMIVAFGMNREYVAWHGLFEKNFVNFGN